MKCSLCNRDVSKLHSHHLFPKKLMKSKNPRIYIHKYGIAPNLRANLCTDCTKIVHSTHTLKELGSIYNTIEKLKRSPKIVKYLRWVHDRPEGVVTSPRRAFEGGKYD